MIRISIITATWNCADTVVDCLASVASQDYPEREHVVIDGASRDNTLAVLEAHRAQLAVLVSEPDKGIYDALNKGIAQASGDVVGFLHADDIYAGPEVLSRIAAAFEANPELDAVYGDLQYVRKDDTSHVVRYWKSTPFSATRLRRGWMPPHPTLYVRRSCYDRIGGFDTSYRIAADYDSILKFFTQRDFQTQYLPTVFVKMRLGGASNRTLKAIFKKSREDWRALRRSGAGIVRAMIALVCKNLSKIGQFK